MMHVCPQCFGNRGLKKRIEEIRPQFPNERCSFHPRYKGVPVSAVAEIVDPVFRAHYGIGDFGYDSEQRGDPLELFVGELVEADDEVTQTLVEQLTEEEDYWPPDGGEPFYEDTQNYVRLEPHFFRHGELWRNFCESIVHDQRFFNSNAKALIVEIFDGVQFQRDHHRQSPIYQIEPNTPEGTFYRAHIADDSSKREEIAKDPAQALGPPPKRLRRAGRMNPAGVGCFYGAYDLTTCIAELRPRVGSLVIGAQFHLERPIYVLDTTRFDAPMKPTSLFAKNYLERMEQWTFMRSFRHEIAQPISPDDEHLDYISTQAVAEYLLNHHQFKRNGKPARIEAIIFQSAQHPNGKNIVLLGDAAHVQPSQPEAKKQRQPSAASEMFSDTFKPFLTPRYEGNNPALRVDAESVETRRVRGAEFDSVRFTERFVDSEEVEL